MMVASCYPRHKILTISYFYFLVALGKYTISLCSTTGFLPSPKVDVCNIRLVRIFADFVLKSYDISLISVF